MGMSLKAWMEAIDISPKELAPKIGVGESMVRAVLYGQKEFSPRIARKVIEVSLGRVTWDDLYPPEATVPVAPTDPAA